MTAVREREALVGSSGKPLAEAPVDPGFVLRLENFEGPFDLLLALISRHQLDVTEVALSQVTDEFLSYARARAARSPDADDPDADDPASGGWDLEQTSSFLLVASTLLDLKAARLLPRAEVEDEEDLALLEARDLLFARLLQYRAFKQVAAVLEERLTAEGRRFPRTVGLEERFAALLPEVVLGLGAHELAELAAKALRPKPVPEVAVEHLHAPLVSVREQAGVVLERVRAAGALSFRALCADAPDTLTRVARFLSLLELFRDGAVGLDQVSPLGELTVRWTGAADTEVRAPDEFDSGGTGDPA
jgi:segregation and condensation protein A